MGWIGSRRVARVRLYLRDSTSPFQLSHICLITLPITLKPLHQDAQASCLQPLFFHAFTHGNRAREAIHPPFLPPYCVISVSRERMRRSSFFYPIPHGSSWILVRHSRVCKATILKFSKLLPTLMVDMDTRLGCDVRIEDGCVYSLV